MKTGSFLWNRRCFDVDSNQGPFSGFYSLVGFYYNRIYPTHHYYPVDLRIFSNGADVLTFYSFAGDYR